MSGLGAHDLSGSVLSLQEGIGSPTEAHQGVRDDQVFEHLSLTKRGSSAGEAAELLGIGERTSSGAGVSV